MEYLNDKTYKRGEEIRVEVKVEAQSVVERGSVTHKYVVAKLIGRERGFELELRGGAPEVDGEEAMITLTGRVGNVADDIYRNLYGVQGALPGDTVRFEKLSTLVRPLKVEGEVEDYEPQ